MDALLWSDRFLTGMPLVDLQHERLVALINEFGELNASTAEVPRAQREAVLDELARYAKTHFVDEEQLMRAAGVDPRFVAAHSYEHSRFLREVGQMCASNFLEAPETSRVLLRFLLHWLAFHILGTDMQLARQVERLQRGESAEDAFAAEVHEVEGPAQLLLGALDDLLRVIAQRNSELTEANLSLEARVAARTAELETTNRRLEGTIEALRSTQVKLVETEKLASVGQLASGLAHEINNPLAFISSNLSALGEHTDTLMQVDTLTQTFEPTLPAAARTELHRAREEADLAFVREDLKHLLSETRDGVKRVQAIVRDLKDFSHVDGGALVDVELKSCVESTLKVVSARHREGVTFNTSFASMPRVRCQAAQVNQALLALVINATQAVHDRVDHRGEVTVRTGVEGNHVFAEVTDNGVGMGPEVLARAFEPFFTTRPPGQGVGLGLSTAWNCAQAHGGKVEAKSQQGMGSTFRLLLAVDGHPAQSTGPSFTNPFNTRRYGST